MIHQFDSEKLQTSYCTAARILEMMSCHSYFSISKSRSCRHYSWFSDIIPFLPFLRSPFQACLQIQAGPCYLLRANTDVNVWAASILYFLFQGILTFLTYILQPNLRLLNWTVLSLIIYPARLYRTMLGHISFTQKFFFAKLFHFHCTYDVFGSFFVGYLLVYKDLQSKFWLPF